jgi:probable F420-dependent oxidoreductase
VVAAQASSATEWAAKAQRAEALGYSSFLVPDRFDFVISPLPALAFAAAVTRTIHVGTFVLACGLRNTAVLTQECRALDLLSGGRFEVGLGAGASEGEFRRAGIDFGSPAERVARVAETVSALKGDNPNRPVLVAGSGRRLLSLAATQADIVGLGSAPGATLAEVGEKAAWIREAAGDRLANLEINLNLLAVGDNPGTRLPARLGLDLEA